MINFASPPKKNHFCTLFQLFFQQFYGKFINIYKKGGGFDFCIENILVYRVLKLRKKMWGGGTTIFL